MNRRGFLTALLAVPLAAVVVRPIIPVIDSFFTKPLLVKHYEAHVVMSKAWVTDSPTFGFGFTGFKPASPDGAVFNMLKADLARARDTMVQSLNEITYGPP